MVSKIFPPIGQNWSQELIIVQRFGLRIHVQGLDYSYGLRILVFIYFYPGTTFGSTEKGVKKNSHMLQKNVRVLTSLKKRIREPSKH